MIQQIIGKLFTREQKSYYLRTLARELGCDAGTAFEFLQQLARLDLVRQDGLRFTANSSHLLYPVLCAKQSH